MTNVSVKPQITDAMVEAAARELCRFGTSFPSLEQTQEWVDAKWHRFKPEAELSLTAALSVPCLQEPVAWQPISTAPKDGTNIIGFWRIYKRPSVMWWNFKDGAFESWADRREEPSHWMPLPPAPLALLEGR
ncbi:MAG TPA: hypothetical protein VHP34_11395 [Alphaproteobacteria bacterium]|nr:hypothetical protein [Alphaproteobacteria bacterium]